MWIDITLLVLVIIGIVRGWQHGFIISVFITAAWILGIIGGLKFCTAAAVALRDHFHFESSYTPVIAFLLVFFIIALIIYWLGKALEKVIEIAQLGFINKLLGIVLRVAAFFFVFSLFIWLINQAGFLSPEIKVQSKTYYFLDLSANYTISFFGQHLPALKSVFNDIEKFFEQLSEKAKTVV